MFSLKVEDNGNKLSITYEGYFDILQAEQFYLELQKIIPKLNKGCIVFVDLSLLERMDFEAKKFIGKEMELLNAIGVSEVIRIIPDKSKDIGFNILSLFHYSPKTKIHTYKSLQEAKELFTDKL